MFLNPQSGHRTAPSPIVPGGSIGDSSFPSTGAGVNATSSPTRTNDASSIQKQPGAISPKETAKSFACFTSPTYVIGVQPKLPFFFSGT